MIPKMIHYCWFGKGNKPRLAEKCIRSWRKFFPEYQIKEWNEENYDVNAIPYTKEAYAARKYAFVSDYARFDILYKNGGVYFDTDVEVIRPMDDIIESGAFMGMERNPILENNRGSERTQIMSAPALNPGLGLAVAPWLRLYKDILDLYGGLHFKNVDGTNNQKTVVSYVTELLLQKGLSPKEGVIDFEGIKIYPAEYFNPKGIGVGMTENTRTIHHFAASWHSPRERLVFRIGQRFGRKAAMICGLLTRNPLTTPKRIFIYLRNGK